MEEFNLEFVNEKKKVALLFGILLGDGCLSCYYPKDRKERRVIAITGNMYDDREFFEKVLVPLLKSLTRNSVRIKKNINAGTIEIHISDRELFIRIKELGFPVGKKGINILVPKYFYEDDLLKYVSQGFFATDGSLVLTKNGNKFYPRIEGNGISESLIRQITDYLNCIGMKGYFYEAKRKGRDLRWGQRQQPYRFQFNGKQNLIIFRNLIGFVNPKHEARYHKFLRYSDEYDNKIRGLSSKKQRVAGEAINLLFYS